MKINLAYISQAIFTITVSVRGNVEVEILNELFLTSITPGINM